MGLIYITSAQYEDVPWRSDDANGKFLTLNRAKEPVKSPN